MKTTNLTQVSYFEILDNNTRFVPYFDDRNVKEYDSFIADIKKDLNGIPYILKFRLNNQISEFEKQRDNVIWNILLGNAN